MKLVARKAAPRKGLAKKVAPKKGSVKRAAAKNGPVRKAVGKKAEIGCVYSGGGLGISTYIKCMKHGVRYPRGESCPKCA